MSATRTCILLLLLLSDSQTANILFLFGGGNISHKISIWPFVIGLADRGHNITFASPSDKHSTKHPNVTEVVPKSWKAFTANMYQRDRLQDRIDGTAWDASIGPYEESVIPFCQLTFDSIDSDKTLNNLVYNGQFDLIVINTLFNEFGFMLAHHFGAKTVVFDSTMFLPWYHGVYGIPIEASWIPHMNAFDKHPMGLFERIKAMIEYYQTYERSLSFTRQIENMFKAKFNLETVPTFLELERNTSLVFINSHHSTDFARSLPPMIVNVGGMQCWNPVGTLPQNFQEYMDGAENGVFLISFGSTIDFSTISRNYQTMFFNTMRKYSHIRFIWRWASGQMADGHPKNILASNWLPQWEILNHPKTIGLMSHGGLNSINEATFHGVPLIVLPFFADQDITAYRVDAQEIGIRLEAKGLSQEMLDDAFEEIITNPKYKRNMMVRSKIFRDRPRSPVEEAVYWTEFVLRNDDTSALRPMLLEQSFWTRTSFDVYFTILGFAILIPLAILLCMTYLFNCIFRK